jgi:hypothetical protein
MRLNSVVIAIFAVAASSCSTFVSAQDSGVFGPLTTNNGISACVQFGSCTDGQSYATTETQNSPITPPASSVKYAAPTNSAESAASISNLALSGAEAAYSSRVANGQNRNGLGNGATVAVDTASVIAGTAPSAVSSQSGRSGTNSGVRMEVNVAQGLWTVFAAVAGVALGGVAIL